MCCSLVTLLVTAPFAARADGPARLVKNINQTIDPRGSSRTYAFTPAGPYIYFLAADSAHSPELWRSDRTPAGTTPWRALGFAPELSDASQILALGDDLIAVGNGVWRTDGTAAGTVQLADEDGWWVIESNPMLFLFRGNELWGSDGSPNRTRWLATLGSKGGETGTLKNVATAGGRIFFTYCDTSDACELWFSDGSPGRTRRVTRLPSPLSYGTGIQDFVAAGPGLFLNRCTDGQCELWHSDGSSAGTWHLAFPPPPPTEWWLGVRHLVVAGNGVFFTGCNETAGCEPWHSDGTVRGTRRLADIAPGPDSGLPEPDDDGPESALVDGALYFLGHAPDTGVELWRSDGSPSGTRLVRDINPGPQSGFIARYDFFSSYRAVFTAVDHALYFAASDGTHGFELWRTDGTADGTVLVADSIPGSAGVFDFISQSDACDSMAPQRIAVGTTLWFVGCTSNDEDEVTGQLWRSDGTAIGTVRVEDGVDRRLLAVLGDGVMFAWYDRLSKELGRRDAARADHLAALPGIIDQWIPFSDGVIFTPRSREIGTEPWWSDGTPAGTYLLRNIGGQDASAAPADLIALGDVLLFSADDGVHGRELWRSDAMDTGTTLVADIHPGAVGSDPAHPIQLGDAALFVADDGVHGTELWRSDGTVAGTQLVADIQPGAGGSDPDRFIVIGDRLFFYADDGVHGRELWRSDGTNAGTVLVRDIRPGTGSSAGLPDNGARAILDGSLYFSANDGVHGFALWRTDGSAEGTVMLVELGRGDADDMSDLFAAGGRLYFLLSGDCPCMWETDGSDAGTHPVDSLMLWSPISVGGETYALGGGGDADGVWRLDKDGAWELAATDPLRRLFAVGDQLFGLHAWGSALWRLGSGFQSPDPARGPWLKFSDFAVADQRVLLYDDYYNALWESDGTAPGTYPLQYLPGPNPLRSDSFLGRTNAGSFTAAGDHIFFVANSGVSGQELWALPVAALTEVCPGDCDHSGTVTITELIIGVNIALGTLPVTTCTALEDVQGTDAVAQLLRAVNAALTGCANSPAP